MSDLVRFGVAMDRALLAEFDERIAEKGYENRSEALRDLVRAELTRVAAEGGDVVMATLTVVYQRKHRADVARGLEGAADVTVVAEVTLPVDAERHLQVVVTRGRTSALDALTAKLGTIRGVVKTELAIAVAEGKKSSPRKGAGS